MIGYFLFESSFLSHLIQHLKGFYAVINLRIRKTLLTSKYFLELVFRRNQVMQATLSKLDEALTFLRDVVGPQAAQIDQDPEAVRDVLKQMGEQELLALKRPLALWRPRDLRAGVSAVSGRDRTSKWHFGFLANSASERRFDACPK